ncbi:MAG: right-handed parallel beta-helix repeat-containing protein [Thermoflexales bacterium]|nr:right-handed parallel beta-helix repeat-containing protein [Thermoflexales bacterium]
MKKGVAGLCLVLALALLPGWPVRAAASLSLYGTFHAMGILVTIEESDDPDGDAMANVSYRVSGSGAYRPGLPLSRIATTRFASSLFWLTPGTAYDVRVTFDDPDGGTLDNTSVSATASTRVEITIPAPAHSYYVSPSGSGTTCSSAAPCSLPSGLGTAQAGDELVLLDGVYYQGDITLPRSGADGAPIVIRGQAGGTAVLDGGYTGPFTWIAQGSGVYHTTVDASDPHLVTADGQRLYPYQSLSDLQGLTWGIPGFYASGTALYVRLAGDADPNGVAMVVSRYNRAFMVEQDYIYFLNLGFRHYGLGEYAKAIYFNNANDNLVQGCTFAVNDLGIGLKRVSNRNVIQDNEFYDTVFDWPWDAVKSGAELETGGIRFYDPMDGRGTVVRRNVFHDYFDGLGACPGSTSAVTNETDVYENLVYRTGDDGMETDGRCSNLRIWRNTFHDVLMGISLAPVYDGPVYAIRNLVYRTGAGNNDYSGSAFKFNSGYDPSGPMYLFHNTGDAALTTPRSSGLDIKSPGEWALIYARNNVWAGTEYALNNANPTQPLDLDYDELYTTRAGELAWWAGLPDRHLNTLDELRTATGQEMHGLNVVPGFANAAAGDYTLSGESELLDAGLIIPGINDDYRGDAPDVGAYEFAPALTLRGMPGDSVIYLNWEVNTALPPTSTWQIAYEGPSGTQPSPISAIPGASRAYTLTGLTNGAWYTVTLNAMLDSTPFLTDTVAVMPTDIRVYLPLVMRNS